MDACFVGNVRMIELLIDAKANLDLMDRTEWTAMHYLEYFCKRYRAEITGEERTKLGNLYNRIKKHTNVKFHGKRRQLGILVKDQERVDDDTDDVHDDFIIEDENLFGNKKKQTSISDSRKEPFERTFDISEKKVVSEKSDSFDSGISRRTISDKSDFDGRDDFRRTSKLSKRNLVKNSQKENDSIVSNLKRKLSHETEHMTADVSQDNEEVVVTQKKKKSKVVVEDDDFDEDFMNAIDSLEEKPTPPVPQVIEEKQPIQTLGNLSTFIIKISNKSIMVPFALSATMADLAQETSKRYFQLYDIRPELVFQTVQEGADLAPSESCASMRPLIGKEINAIIKKWNTTACDESYIEFCEKDSIIATNEMKVKLANVHSSGKFELNSNTDAPILKPAMKALRFQTDLNYLVFSNCQLQRYGELFKSICELLPTLENLNELDLSCNGLAASHMAEIRKSVIQLPRLTSLNLSVNFLTDSSAPDVSQIVSQLSDLRILRLRSCYFTSEVFRTLKLKNQLVELDLSFNRLGVSGIEKVSRTIQEAHYLQRLDLSGCIKTSEIDKERLLEAIRSISEITESSLEKVVFRMNKISSDLKSKLLKFGILDMGGGPS